MFQWLCLWFMFTCLMIGGVSNIILGNFEMSGVIFILAYLVIDKVET